VIVNVIHKLVELVTNITMAKAMCATCLLACGVQVWSSEAMVDDEEKVK